jgi:hypothetical protein
MWPLTFLDCPESGFFSFMRMKASYFVHTQLTKIPSVKLWECMQKFGKNFAWKAWTDMLKFEFDFRHELGIESV